MNRIVGSIPFEHEDITYLINIFDYQVQKPIPTADNPDDYYGYTVMDWELRDTNNNVIDYVSTELNNHAENLIHEFFGEKEC